MLSIIISFSFAPSFGSFFTMFIRGLDSSSNEIKSTNKRHKINRTSVAATKAKSDSMRIQRLFFYRFVSYFKYKSIKSEGTDCHDNET